MVASKLENKLLAVVRIRGQVNVRSSIKETLKRLNLDAVNNISLVYGTKSNIGMVQKCKDYVAYGEISSEILKSLMEKKAGKADASALKEMESGAKSPKEFVSMPMRMKPPKRGYKAIKQAYTASGDLGYRGPEINRLISRML